jgi:Major Facilitator Superfamily
MFCIVYGFSNAASHSWGTASTWAFLAAGAVLLTAFGAWQARAPQPLLPLRIVADRNRAGAYLSMLIAGAGMFGVLLFLNFYMQQNLAFSPVRTGLAFLPMVALTMAGNNISAMVLMPRTGPRPLVAAGMLLAGGGGLWLTQLGAHSGYATCILPAVLLVGAGLGLIFAPVVTTGTSAVPPADTGVASATVNAGNQLGGSIGTSLLNTIFAGAITAYIAAHTGPATFTRGRPAPALITAAQLHAYHTVFWWAAAIYAGGAVIAAVLLRSGPLPIAAHSSDHSGAGWGAAGPDGERPAAGGPGAPDREPRAAWENPGADLPRA